MRRRSAVVALLTYLLVLASGTLGASPSALFDSGARLARTVAGLHWVTFGDVERAANVVLFAPAGLLLCLAFPGVTRWLVWVWCVAGSVSVEAAQLALPARQPSPLDVVMNSTGAAVGVLVHVAVNRWFRRRRRNPATDGRTCSSNSNGTGR